MSWSGWGTKLNVTSIVSQGLEQVRTLREDVEKSFDQVVTGAPGARTALPLAIYSRPTTVETVATAEKEEAEEKTGDQDQATTDLEVKETVDEDAEEQATHQDEEQKQEEAVEEDSADTVEEAGPPSSSSEEKQQTEEAVQKTEPREEAESQIEDQETEDQDAQKEEVEEDKADELKDEQKEAGSDSDSEQKEVGESGEDVEAQQDVSMAALQKELEMRESQLLATSTTIRELHDELDKTCRREVVAVEKTRYLTEQLELMRGEVNKLSQLHRETSSNQSADVQALQMALAEKEEKLSALLDEGQALSVKQAQLEQRLRTLRKEKDELEERALKAQSQFEASDVQVKDLTAKLKTSDEEKTRLAQENRQLTSSADSTTVRVEKADREAREASQQLENLQIQVEQLTLAMTRKDEEIEALKTTTQANEALSLEKAGLQQTITFLQENVRDLEQEASRREEMARTEIAGLKRKWQDAVARVDMLGQSVSEATQPLLRQIHALQEDQRARQESWKATESALTARIEESTQRRRTVEEEKLDSEHEVHELRRNVEEMETQLTRRKAELTRVQDAVENAKSEVRELRGQVDALQIDLEQARHQRETEIEARKKLQARLEAVEKASKALEESAATSVELEQSREREAQLQHDLEWHQEELLRLKAAPQTQVTSAPLSTGSTSSQRHYAWRSFDSEQNNGVDSSLSSEASILKTTLETTMGDSLSSNGGNTSVLGLSQLQQRLRLREGENRMLKQQLEALEARQKQTTDEIVRLSTRNALLESGEAQREQTQLELAKLQKHQVVLLELFGEKEEQVEELQAEVGELKAFYRKQLDTLATQNEQQQKQRADHQH